MLLRATPYSLFIFALLLAACEDNAVPEKILSSYDASYMLYPDGVVPSPSGNIALLERDDDGAITKRTGGLISIPVATGYFFQFRQEVFDLLAHSPSHITITQTDNLDELDVYPTERRVFFDGDDRIEKVIRRMSGDRYDTLVFNYDGDVLRTIVVKSSNRIETRNFYYDDSNLVRIESRETNRALALRSVTLEEFGEYDNAPNPTKDLRIFEEVLYRSISRNNFTYYKMEKRDQGGRVIDSREISWNLHYDSDGVPTYL